MTLKSHFSIRAIIVSCWPEVIRVVFVSEDSGSCSCLLLSCSCRYRVDTIRTRHARFASPSFRPSIIGCISSGRSLVRRLIRPRPPTACEWTSGRTIATPELSSANEGAPLHRPTYRPATASARTIGPNNKKSFFIYKKIYVDMLQTCNI